MPNPFFDNRTSPNNATEPNNPLNDDSKNYSRGFSTFDYGRNFYNTLRYADITPHEVVEAGACRDKIPFGSRHEIRSHTLSSVMMSDIYMKKQYYAVDYRSFLPNTWQKIFTHPIEGDDISSLEANTVIENILSYLGRMCQMFSIDHSTDLDNHPNDRQVWLEGMVRGIFLLECFFSNGSLLSSLGWKGASYISVDSRSFDYQFDRLIDDLKSINQGFGYVTPNGDSYGFGPIGSDFTVSAHTVLETIRHNFEYGIYVEGVVYGVLRDFYSNLYASFNFSEYLDHQPFNYSRVCAYKMVTSNFYTNDKIDSIYSNHLWLENMDWTWRQIFGNHKGAGSLEPIDSYEHYYYNDIYCTYDVLSGNRVRAAFEALSTFGDALGVSGSLHIADTSFYYAIHFLHNLFSYDSSLRYGDYYTGAKSRPLAVGDTDLVETGEGVSTVEAVRRFSITRFLNQVGRIGPRLRDYVKGVMKGVPAPDVTIPRFLASVTSSVSGFEVENTAQDQGNIITLLKSSDSHYIYEVEVGEPCIILGLTTFEVPRVYSRASDKFFFHVDRFDMFNPFLENLGDQAIELQERSLSTGPVAFAYTGRYMEYKQRVPMASGGFIEFLPTWLFVTDNESSEEGSFLTDTAYNASINESFIRSKNYEMDRFYSSLTGYSLASYFHFIVKYQNSCRATRQMQYNPQIL